MSEPIDLTQARAVLEELGYHPDGPDGTYVSTGKVTGPKALWFIMPEEGLIWPETFYHALVDGYEFLAADVEAAMDSVIS